MGWERGKAHEERCSVENLLISVYTSQCLQKAFWKCLWIQQNENRPDKFLMKEEKIFFLLLKGKVVNESK